MKSYEQALHDLVATHAAQRASLKSSQDAAVRDLVMANDEEWREMDRWHARDWFELRRQYKKPIGPGGLAMLAGASPCTRR